MEGRKEGGTAGRKLAREKNEEGETEAVGNRNGRE